MSEPNPYEPPTMPAPSRAGVYSAGGRAVDAGRGWEWIAEGFALFKQQPGMWILVLIAWIVCVVILALVPVIGSLAIMLLMQVFMGGMMLGCRALDNGDGFDIGCLFAGFKQNTGDLVVLGVLGLVGSIIAAIPAIVIMGGGAFMALFLGSGSAASQATATTTPTNATPTGRTSTTTPDGCISSTRTSSRRT